MERNKIFVVKEEGNDAYFVIFKDKYDDVFSDGTKQFSILAYAYSEIEAQNFALIYLLEALEKLQNKIEKIGSIISYQGNFDNIDDVLENAYFPAPLIVEGEELSKGFDCLTEHDGKFYRLYR